MLTTGSIDAARSSLGRIRAEGKKIGLIPTMGALHKGHISLAEISAKHDAHTVMSIFVNKIQFNDQNDYLRYPKTLDDDIRAAEKGGVDLLFTPSDVEIYNEHRTYIDVDYLTDELCGAHRPGHFRGVYTVVAKLFNIIQPDFAVFGQKDIQQAVTIEKMVNDLNFPIEIIIAPIVREDDGLAMSSRNIHLTKDERERALSIHQSLKIAADMITNGERSSAVITDKIKFFISENARPDKIDYISVTDYNTLHQTDNISGKAVLAIAAYFGKTRLIDNMIINTSEANQCVF